MVQLGSTWAEAGPDLIDFAHTSTDSESSLADFRRVQAKVGGDRTTCGRIWARFGRFPAGEIGPHSTEYKPNSAEFGPILAEFGADLIELVPNLADSGSSLVDFVRVRAISGGNRTSSSRIRGRSPFGRIGPDLAEICRLRPKVGRYRPRSGRFRANVADFGRACPRLGHVWPEFDRR